ncbi:MAG: ABC transporter substrate-binding protein [Candidatus Dactylopiibacterium carminicum]|uniref:ABC transporter substrate-binding protein n=1 Tax=Candidatus Dactylopiibacterium carminicum TaxID=857335 RepID=A0A272EVN2_9RHOO|nr:ABC transporter substrate-binding protein [Candidatus Dactylopiibacterium carminicum]KAF7599890.1 ABC transporter substrate-binding protein [Candidatus Dactylopiibacterium carminicum]PAS94171.1 MAG: ABC transporter substrate-binding protein [Candidatus Dactylopiibacterium carminicum]PAS96757.1 MAG: ABC transporter substrate-binding protein [Candidatus Dactylopiibacterium carminicum]PAS99891.1 MAG: ABC transporter substrate-binding protein [Candidatus Dactylopiibacterium carminicum]
MFKKFAPLLLSVALIAPGLAAAQGKSEVKLGFAKCAHCLPMALTPEYSSNTKIEAINFNSGNDVLTALVSKSIDVAQVTYLHFITALDKGFDVVAISGQVNGGSEILTAKGVDLKADDWDALKKLIAIYKAQGKPFRVAASRGNAQDIHMRGELMLHGINPNKDVQFINIPNPSDHAAALQRGEVELICTVEPFASQIRMSGVGKHFSLPYNQAAGNLTNLIVTRSDVIKEKPQAVRDTVGAVVQLVDKLKSDRQAWVEVINKYTAMDANVANEALKNAYPDYFMHRKSAQAIAVMMKDLKYVANDVSAGVDKAMDYSFLSAVTGKPKTELGY